MLKGFQVDRLKHGDFQLTLHRQFKQPLNVSNEAWRTYMKDQEQVYKIAKPSYWWMGSWLTIKAATNIAIAKNTHETVIDPTRCWIRIYDDIAISLFSEAAKDHPHYGPNCPFHPGALETNVRIPIDWWNENIEDATDAVKKAIANSKSSPYSKVNV